MLSINIDLTSLFSRQHLQQPQQQMQTAVERLSSGLRINSAADDAAGSAIATRLSSRVNGVVQAQQNVNNGISLAQTAQSSLGKMDNNLLSMRVLTIDALNGTHSQKDLNSLQTEVDFRLKEINRIANATSFNDLVLFQDQRQIDIQVNSDDGDTISLYMQRIDTTALGLHGYDIARQILQDDNFGNRVTDGSTNLTVRFQTDHALLSGIADGNNNATSAEAIYARRHLQNAYAVLANNTNFYQLDTQDSSQLIYNSASQALSSSQVNVDAGPVDFINATLSVLQAASIEGDGIIQLLDESGNVSGEYLLDNGDGSYNALTITSSGAASKGEAVTVSPLSTLDFALDKISTLQSQLGATQNRLDSVIRQLGSSHVNLSAARSRIIDADFADESLRLARSRLLQNSTLSMLTQANQSARGALSLLSSTNSSMLSGSPLTRQTAEPKSGLQTPLSGIGANTALGFSSARPSGNVGFTGNAGPTGNIGFNSNAGASGSIGSSGDSLASQPRTGAGLSPASDNRSPLITPLQAEVEENDDKQEQTDEAASNSDTSSSPLRSIGDMLGSILGNTDNNAE